MKGHDALANMRRGRIAPAIVFVETDVDKLKQWADWSQSNPALACLWVEPEDTIGLLDFCSVVGLTVSVSGSDANRVKRVHDACVSAGAKRVISNVCAPDAYGDPKVQSINDSQGILTWRT